MTDQRIDLGTVGIRNRMSADTVRSAAAHFRARLAGRWEHRCYKAIKCDDPASFLDIASQCGVDVVKPGNVIRQGIVFDHVVRSVVARSRANQPVLRRLDKMLSGGGLRWVDRYENLVVNEGLDHVLDVVLSGGTQDTSWFVGLLATSPSPVATWTATEIAANDFVNYSEANLQAFTDGGVSGQSVDNSASKANFSIDTNSSVIGGAYLIGTNAKAVPAGTLYAAGAFTGGDKNADSGDTLAVTCTFTAADA